MGLERGRELGVQAHPLLLRQLRQARQALLGGPRQGQDLAVHRQQLGLGLAYQRHEDFAHPSALSAEAAHELLEVVLEVQSLRLQLCALGDALARLWTR